MLLYDNALDIQWGKFLPSSLSLTIIALSFWHYSSIPNLIVIGFDCPAIYTYITIIQDDGTIRGSFYADKVGSPIPVTYATDSIFLDQTHLYVGYIDNGLGRLRLTIFP